MSAEGTCLKDCISFLFNIPSDKIENFVEYEDWLDRFNNYMNLLGYKVHIGNNEDITEDEIPNDIYLVWEMSVRGNYHSVIHKNGHLYYDAPCKITKKEEEYIVDQFHSTCDKWIFGVKDIYEYVWFEKIEGVR